MVLLFVKIVLMLLPFHWSVLVLGLTDTICGPAAYFESLKIEVGDIINNFSLVYKDLLW